MLAAALALTAAATSFVHETAIARDQLRFDMAVEDSRDLIEHQIQTYIGLLRGASGLFAADSEVDLPAFRNYVARLDLKKQYRGIQGIGFSRRIRPGETAVLEARMRAYYPDFRVWGEDPKSEPHSIVFLEPLDELNKRAIGYNMFSNPVRRGAMIRARDTGEPAASAKVRLVQEGRTGQMPGFLVYVPVYRTGEMPADEEARRQNLVGFVYSPFRMGDFIAGVFENHQNPQVRFDIWDGSVRTPEHAMYHGERPGVPTYRPVFTEDTIIHVPGHQWSVRFETNPAFHEASGRDVVPLTLVGGLIISGLLFGITMVQAQSRDAAVRSAEDLRRSRDAAEHTAEELRKSEARARRLVESNVIGVVFEHVDGRITEANDAFLEMLGYTRADLAAGRLNWKELTPDEYAARDRAAIEQFRETGKNAPYEKEYVRADGTRVPVLVGAAQLEPGSDLAVGYLVDMTEQKRAEEEVRAGREELRRLYAEAQSARAAAEEANRLKDEFLATVSHELRTPLNAIMGYAQLLRIGRRSPEDTARALEAIERNVKAQAQLIEDLLDVSRIISGKLRLEVQRVDLGAVIQAAVESVAPAAAAKDIRLAVDMDPTTGQVAGDPNRLQQIVWNLMANAIKFTGTGGQVSVSAHREDGHACIVVRDTGVGIDREFLHHIFDRFRQVDSSTTRRHGGLGLGLSIVRNLVELHGGSVHAESEGEGCGSAFTVRLPLSTRADGAGGLQAAPAVLGRERSRTGSTEPGQDAGPDGDARLIPDAGPDICGVRVLVVDDEPDARMLVQEILQEYGAEVRSESSAEAAMAALPDFRPDVLLSDIAMPGEDGYSLIRRVRALGPERGGRVPAAALTAFARAEDRRRALLAGFHMHVPKPIEPEDLRAVVASLAGRVVSSQ